MKVPDAKGVYVIAPTPFHADGRIDESSIDRMCDFFVKSGVDGMTVLGQLGEAPKMAHEEAVGIVKGIVGETGAGQPAAQRRAGRAGVRQRSLGCLAAGCLADDHDPRCRVAAQDRMGSRDVAGRDTQRAAADFGLNDRQ